MKLLAIDWGEKRLGLAISQDEKWAFPWKVLEITGLTKAIEAISEIIEAEKIETLVIGLPIGLNGKDTEQTSRIREIVADLRNVLEVPVETVDERLTSEAAEKLNLESGKTKGPTDAVAAAQILETFLQQKNS
ncbi:Holliday junction resolvase RuvX [Candidatus Parcubacteria bacterium]|jgi:putative Holliday junction resolvase|nr:MAG: Holliday junction resolvase RuvX [Candidatus Parcubacteria bacterium]